MPIQDVLRRELTDEQRLAATDPTREVLTLACAGSGKSRTLAYRIAWLLAERRAEPDSIVAFTFTEKAADSIKQRVASALANSGIDANALGAMYIGTIHSYCQFLLGQIDARYRQFEVLDENRLLLYLISRYPGLEIAPLRATRANAGRQPGYFSTISKVANAWMTMNEEFLNPQQVENHDPRFSTTLQTIQDSLDRDEYLDFSLMQRLVVDALQRRDEGALRVVQPLRHLLVDEYQDINPIQERLISFLSEGAETLFVVGDDDQSVYAWRGADVSRILTFQERFPQSALHTLNQNFRSTPLIVEVADGFAGAELGATRLPKNPVAAHDVHPQDFRAVWFDTRDEEAAWVVDRIRALLGTEYREGQNSRGLTAADFAILMQSTRTNEANGAPRHRAFTSALEAAGIPYSLEAGGGLFDRPQVEALRASFALLRENNPDRAVARAHFDAVVLPHYPQANFNAFVGVIATWGRQIHAPVGQGPRRRIYPQALVHDLLESFGIQNANFDEPTMQDIGVFSRIMQDVETVYMSVDTADRFQWILNFLDNVADTGYDAVTSPILRRPDAVTVSTVHKVKGLEFPGVFLVDVESQRFPRSNRRYDGWMPPALLADAINRGAYQSTRPEQTRLFYTALTRAERYLYVSGAANLPGARQVKRPSAFSLRLNHPNIGTDATGLPNGLTAAPQRRRIEESDLPTSYSDIRYYLRCPKDYQYRKIFGFSPPIVELFGFGMTVHAAVGKLHERFQDNPPTAAEAAQLAEDLFHLKHVPQSRDPINNPGPYERAKTRAGQLVAGYAEEYRDDFLRRRQVEARFEIPVHGAVVSGAIDLMLHEDAAGNFVEASVIDFKTMEGGDDPLGDQDLEWTELALQVQLYARAARDVLRQAAGDGYVHLLKDNQRIEIPVDDAAIAIATQNIEWAVDRIVSGDFPMRPERQKCEGCDFGKLCRKRPEQFSVQDIPPEIRVPGVDGRSQMVAAFSRFDADFQI